MSVSARDVAVERGHVFRARGGKRVAVESVDSTQPPPRVVVRVLPSDPLAALTAALDGEDTFEVVLTWSKGPDGAKAWRMPCWYEPDA